MNRDYNCNKYSLGKVE